ncbi:hypothetical protein KNP414_01133 [Paenibacillus mucilaginosus KNP414]|uniref:Uncharacterized protein n=1 Tax=Paenibacillus mucilaginosus (strain KNP414) TaxID=1036673 RepID=F8FF00_PAEMK|nr:hypothetical protein KNP414_01133 [Paenibacillus mucilaginosus KNP414]
MYFISMMEDGFVLMSFVIILKPYVKEQTYPFFPPTHFAILTQSTYLKRAQI